MFKKSIIHYDSRERLLKQFFILYNKYFDFRKCLVNRKSDGSLVYVRKYLCPRIELFKYDNDVPFKPCRNVTKRKRPDRVYKMLANRLAAIVDDDKNSREVMAAAQILVGWMQNKLMLAVDENHRTTDKVLMIVDRVKRMSEQADATAQRWFQEDYEKRIMYTLMRKYGIAAPPKDCPF